MYQIQIKRTYKPLQTEGDLVVTKSGKEIFTCKVLELPWKNNSRNVSCIPAGTYEAVKHNSPKFGPSFWLQNVIGRSEILMHFGNFAGSKNPRTRIPDTRGCLLPGKSFTDIDGDGILDVTHSKATMEHLFSIMPQQFPIIIS
jgi:hypothetical protein